jgi:hypothetical protein
MLFGDEIAGPRKPDAYYAFVESMDEFGSFDLEEPLN